MYFAGACRLTVVFLWIVLAWATASVAGGTGWGKVSPEEWSIGAPTDYPEANAIVIHDVCSLIVRNSGIEITRWKRMKLLTKAGADEIGDVGFPYYEDDKVRDLKAQTITPDGKAIKLTSKDYFTKTIGGTKLRTFAFPGLDSGCIVEFQYRNLNTRFRHLDPWFFQSEVYTLKSQFTLIVGPGFTYSASWSNVPMSSRTAKTGHMPNADDPPQPFKTYTWELSNLTPVTEEPYMAAKWDYYSAMYYQLVSYKDMYNTINFVRNWKDLGKEFQEYIDEYARGSNIEKRAGELTTGMSDLHQKAQALYDYVANEIQYKDEAGTYFSNENLGQLLKTGIGTGEEKNILLAELMKKVGIQAWPVLISTRQYRKFNPEIYQMRQFNYLILLMQIDSTYTYLDAASKFCPFGMLPPKCLVEAGFLIDGDNSEIVKVLGTEQRTYRLDVTAMHIDSTGSVRCSTVSSLSGYFAPDYGAEAEASGLTDFVKDYYLDRLGVPCTLDTALIEKESTGKCLVSFTYSLPEYTRQLDSMLAVKPVNFRFRTTPFTKPRRTIPVDFNYPFTYHNIVTVTSDLPLSSAVLPPDTVFQIDGASYRRATQFGDGELKFDSRLAISTPVFSPIMYPGIRRLFEFTAQAQSEEAMVVRKP